MHVQTGDGLGEVAEGWVQNRVVKMLSGPCHFVPERLWWMRQAGSVPGGVSLKVCP